MKVRAAPLSTTALVVSLMVWVWPATPIGAELADPPSVPRTAAQEIEGDQPLSGVSLPENTEGVVETVALPAQPTAIQSALLLDAPDVGRGLRLGGLSGLVAQGVLGQSFIAITDRGPNRDVKVRGEKATAFLVPEYSSSIVKLQVDEGRLEVVERLPLRLAWGTDPVTGRTEVSGLPTSSRDEPAYDATGSQRLGFDPNGVDPEGIAVDPRDGTYWICEEYGPSILHVAADGTILMRLVPLSLPFNGVGYEVRGALPSVLMSRKRNRGLEGIAISPDGKTLFSIMESPLSLPDNRAGEASRNIRLVAIDISSSAPSVSAMYLYQADSFVTAGAREQDDVKVGDLAAVSATRLVVLEHDSSIGASHRKVYAIDLSGATDLLTRAFPGGGLEQMSDMELALAGIAPVTKSLVADLAPFRQEWAEGLTIVDPTTIAVINDNNFDPAAPSELVLIRLPTSLD